MRGRVPSYFYTSIPLYRKQPKPNYKVGHGPRTCSEFLLPPDKVSIPCSILHQCVPNKPPAGLSKDPQELNSALLMERAYLSGNSAEFFFSQLFINLEQIVPTGVLELQLILGYST